MITLTMDSCYMNIAHLNSFYFLFPSSLSQSLCCVPIQCHTEHLKL